MSASELYEQIIRALIDDYNMRRFRPILEIDILGHMYHLTTTMARDGEVHLATRVCGVEGDKKFDFVVGLRSDEGERSCVNPHLICEVKCLPTSFTFQQCQTRVSEAIDRDLPKLALQQLRHLPRSLIVLDERRHLRTGKAVGFNLKIDRIISVRNQLDSRIMFDYLERNEKGSIQLNRL